MIQARGGPTILVLDDTDSRREAVSRMLRTEGYRVVPARSSAFVRESPSARP